MKHGVVYRITNTETDKCYIGRTKDDLRKRWYHHCSRSSNCCYLKHAIEKYGKESFSIKEIASSWDAENLKELEMLLIQQENTLVPNGYNLINTGLGISETSDLTRKKLSDGAMGVSKSDEHRRNISKGRKGIIFSAEHCKNISDAKKGQISSTRGKTLSQETRDKISAAQKGKPRPHAGQPCTLEARRKISESLKARNRTVSK